VDVVEADADHQRVVPGGEVVGHRELLGRGARYPQLRLRSGMRDRRARLVEDGRITACSRVHHDHDPPLRGCRSRLNDREDRERQEASDGEET
jgi:hypothetical protein